MRTLIGSLLLCLLAVLPPSGGASTAWSARTAQQPPLASQGPATSRANQPQTAAPVLTLPARSFALPTGLGRPTMVAGVDGHSVYLLDLEPSVNLWKSLVYRWPEIGTAMGCIAALLLVGRVARRPQIVGEQHCRRCNYLLKNIVTGRCPECGTRLTVRTVMRGSRRGWRIALLAAFILGYLAIYLSGGLSDVRRGRASQWFDWRSTRLAQFDVSNRWTTLRAGHEPQYVVLRVDTSTGTTRKIHIDARDDIQGLTIAADGRSLAVWGKRNVFRYSSATGVRERAMSIEDAVPDSHWSDRIGMARFSPDLRTAHVLLTNGRLDQWNLDDRSVEPLLALTPAQAQSARFESPPRSRGELAVLTAAGRVVVTAGQTPPEAMALDANYSAVLPDGRLIGPFGQFGVDALVVRSPRAVVQRRYPLPAGLTSIHAWALSNDGRWLLADHYANPRDLFVFDFSSNQWSNQLTQTTGVPCAGMAMPDHRTVARLVATGPAGTAPFQLLVYELTSAEVGSAAQP